MQPKYLQLAHTLEDLIESMDPNTMIPSERELVKRYDMSRMTVRKAIDHLVAQNKLYRVNKIGTFTTDKKIYKQVDAFFGFSREVRAGGGKPSNELIEYTLTSAGEDIAKRLNIAVDDPIYKVTRLRKKNGVPIMVDEAHFPKSIITLNEEAVQGSIYEYISNILGLNIATANQRFQATFAPKTYQGPLEIGEYTPIIKVDVTVYLHDGRIFEATTGYINTEHYILISKSYQ